MPDLKAIASDVKTWTDGEWVDLGILDHLFIDPSGDVEKNTWVLVRSIRSDHFRRAHARARRSIDRMQARGVPVDPIKADEATRAALGEACLLGWRNLTEDGNEIIFSPAEAKRVMLQNDYGRFQNAVANAASQVGEKDAEWQEQHLPNSSGGSGKN